MKDTISSLSEQIVEVDEKIKSRHTSIWTNTVSQKQIDYAKLNQQIIQELKLKKTELQSKLSKLKTNS